MMNFTFHPEAEKEIKETTNYYEHCQEDLGLEFAKEVYVSIENIVLYPKAWTIISKNTRRCLLKRFPFGIIYQEVNDTIIIIAIMQLNKTPKYWIERT